MLGGQAAALWFLGSAAACLLLLAWTAIVGLGADRHRMLSVTLFALTLALAALPTGVGVWTRRQGPPFGLPFSVSLFVSASLCLIAAVLVLWRMRRLPGVQRAADLAIAACLNLWLALFVVLSPLGP